MIDFPVLDDRAEVRYQNEHSAIKRRVDTDGADWVSEGAWTLGLVSWPRELVADEKSEWCCDDMLAGDGRNPFDLSIQPGWWAADPARRRPPVSDMVGVEVRCRRSSTALA